VDICAAAVIDPAIDQRSRAWSGGVWDGAI
jgi:hypothetical protein